MVSRSTLLRPLSNARHQSRSLRIAMYALGAALVVTLVLHLVGKSSESAKEWILEYIVLTVMFYIAGEFYKLHHMVNEIESRLLEGNKLICQSTVVNNVENFLTHSVLRVFEHEDDLIRSALTQSIEEFTPRIRGDYRNKNTIEFNSPYISTTAYIHFWKQVLQAQLNLKSSSLSDGKSERIEVFSAHATDLNIWNDNDVIYTQNQFTLKNGCIYRIMIRNQNSPESLEEYNKVIERMSGPDFHVFFLDAKLIKAQRILTDDYFLAEINKTKYAMTWDADWRTGTGVVRGCRMSTDANVVDGVKTQWLNLVYLLEKQANLPRIYNLPFLDARPAPDIIEKMKQVFVRQDS